MKYARLGRTALEVSRLCLGTMNFGPFTSPEESFAIMDAAREAGVNFLDTADVYGRDKGKGATEEIVGAWLAQGGGRREDTVLATKVFGRMGEKPNERGLSARHIRDACEASLRRLGTDRIDLYQMHHVDRTAPWEEIWPAMENLVREGKVLYVGSSNFAGWHIATANQVAARRNFLGLVSEQSLYNLTERTVELEVIPACLEYGLGVLPWSPLAMGALASAGVRGKEQWAGKVRTRLGERLDRWFAFCRERGEEPAAVALAWLLSRPAVTAPILGPRTMDQFTGSLRALGIELSAAF
ncbi:MAG: aldo/keto reductase [Planctomycetes bacterium]|nr:aldo/keto reductase [Planctomycetota bacterium]